jgi:hypothetical protein
VNSALPFPQSQKSACRLEQHAALRAVTAAKVGYTAIMIADHIGGDKRTDGTDLDPARRASIIPTVYAT